MQNICKLYLVRHGESAANRDGRVGGHFDSPLTNEGEAEAVEARQLLAGIHFDTAYSSDLRRATKTGEIIYGHEIPKSHQLFDLRERSFGKLENGPAAVWFEIDKQFDKRYASLPFEQRMKHDYADDVEGDGPLCARFINALQSIARQHPGQTVLVATHGGPIRALLMKLGYADFLPAGSFENAGFVALDSDGTSLKIRKVVGVNKQLASAE